MGNRSSYSDYTNKGYVLNNGVLEKPSITIKNNPKVITKITAQQFNDGYGSSIDTVVFDIDPMPKPRMTSGDKANYRPITKKYWAYKSHLNTLAAEANYIVGDKIDIEFHIAMPQSWNESLKEKANGMPHQLLGDIDNFLKAIFDCLKSQDKTVWSIKAVKVWSYTGKIIINR